ncbi:ABC transporter permease subunit [Halomicroarcula limicola]|uniref:ABC transporter permease subunit n=1 Tax=Haloarcula limicola TaxID=1429915 RepID=A0A8J7Y3M8_9EURY|nr:ABC transporter permease subunit [Halomicroarcula limicola]MBV0924135.1 ABC transporter permease subunit [Halomicroarcula limicola]
MGILSGIGRKLKTDVKNVAMTPVDTVRNWKYTYEAVQRGEVPASEVVKVAVSTVLATIMVLALLFPIYWILMAALSGSGSSLYTSESFRLFPDNPTLKPFIWVVGDLIVPGYTIGVGIPLTDLSLVFNTPEITLLDASAYGVDRPSAFKKFLWNSVTVAIPTVLISMALIIPASYALSRKEFLLRRKVLFAYVLFTQIGGGLGVALLIGMYALYVQFGINNSKLALSVYYAATAVPFNTWLLKTYMDGIPVSYEEAAVVDGAPPWRVVTEVILPMSAAGLATVFIFIFLTGWTEFVVAQTLLGTENYTLPVGLYSLVGEYSIPWARFSAFALTFALPIMLVYLFAQRYIEGGLSFSGMEG